MNAFVWLGLGNLALAVPLAGLAWLVGRYVRRPALTHGLWVLVLMKLVTPPLGIVPVRLVEKSPSTSDTAVIAQADEPVRNELRNAVNSLVPPQPLDIDWDAFDGDGFRASREADVVQQGMTSAAGAVRGGGEVGGEMPLTPHLTELAMPWAVPVLGGLWVLGAVVCWGRTLRKAWQFERCLREATPAPQVIRERVRQLAAEMGAACPNVAFVPGTITPLLWVWGRKATLVLPKDFFETLDLEMQTTLLVHELAHWRRGDHWVRRLECLAGGLYWWCPLAWWAQAGVRQAEEELCDAWVVATLPDSARVYALALVETVDFLAGARPLLPPLASGLGPFPSLQRRLTMIFRTGIPRRLTFVGLLGLLGLGGLFLTWSPGPMAAQAQDEERPRKKKDGAPREPGPRDGDVRPEGKPRDGDVRPEGKPRDGERRPEGKPRDGEGRPEGKPRDGEDRPAPKRGDAGPEDLQRLREELRARQAELERLQLELQKKARDLQQLMEKARGFEGGPGGGRPDFKRPVPPERGDEGKKPRPDENRGPRPEGGPDMGRRLDELEQKLEMMIREFGSLRRDMSGRGGPGGPPPAPPRRDGDNDGPPRDGKNKDKNRGDAEQPFNRKGPGNGRGDGQPRPGARQDEQRPEVVPVPPRRAEDPRP